MKICNFFPVSSSYFKVDNVNLYEEIPLNIKPFYTKRTLLHVRSAVCLLYIYITYYHFQELSSMSTELQTQSNNLKREPSSMAAEIGLTVVGNEGLDLAANKQIIVIFKNIRCLKI